MTIGGLLAVLVPNQRIGKGGLFYIDLQRLTRILQNWLTALGAMPTAVRVGMLGQDFRRPGGELWHRRLVGEATGETPVPQVAGLWQAKRRF